MMDCWLENPSKRPSFEELKAKFEAFSNYDHLLIQFPKGGDSNYPYANTMATEPLDNNLGDLVSAEEQPLLDYLTIQTQTVGEQNGNLLEVECRMRRISSEPILERDGQGGLTNDQEGEEEFRKRSLSNSYVRTPKTDSRFGTRQSRKFVWSQEIPEVHICAVKEGD